MNQRIVGVTLAAALSAGMFLEAPEAQAGSKDRGLLTLGAGAVAIYGLATHRRALAAAGAVGTAVGYHNYRVAKARENRERDAAIRREAYYNSRRSSYYSSYPSSSYSSNRRYSQVSPYRYESGSSSYRRTRHYTRRHRVRSYHRSYARHYPYHAWLHQPRHTRTAAVVRSRPLVASAVAHPATLTSFQTGPSVAGAVAPRPNLQPVSSNSPATPRIAEPATPATANTSSFAAGFGTGLLTLLLGLGIGLAVPRVMHRGSGDGKSTQLRS